MDQKSVLLSDKRGTTLPSGSPFIFIALYQSPGQNGTAKLRFR
jgi:hypothetical protein